MDGRGFDNVTRRLARGASRRSVMKALIGVGATAMAVRAGGTLAQDGSRCAKQCSELFPEGRQRGECVSQGARGEGPCTIPCFGTTCGTYEVVDTITCDCECDLTTICPTDQIFNAVTCGCEAPVGDPCSDWGNACLEGEFCVGPLSYFPGGGAYCCPDDSIAASGPLVQPNADGSGYSEVGGSYGCSVQVGQVGDPVGINGCPRGNWTIRMQCTLANGCALIEYCDDTCSYACVTQDWEFGCMTRSTDPEAWVCTPL
jgi:hypothetical protein